MIQIDSLHRAFGFLAGIYFKLICCGGPLLDPFWSPDDAEEKNSHKLEKRGSSFLPTELNSYFGYRSFILFFLKIL